MFVMTNTDIIILTTFSSMANLSVYSVYALIINGIRKGIKAFTNALEAPFGNMIAKNEKKALYENLSIIELIMYSMSTIIYTVAIIIILQFVSVYTKGISDANYLVPLFAYILLVAQFFDSIRNPYQLVVQAAGHYKQTKVGSIIEPIINITLSTVFVLKYGLVGVAIGTLVATVFRTIQYSFYMCKNIVKRNQLITIFKIFVSIVESLTIILVINILKLDFTSNFMQLIINFIIVLIISCFVVLLSNYFIFRKDYKNTIKK